MEQQELEKQVEELEKEQNTPDNKKKKKKPWKYILNISIVLIITIVSIVITLNGQVDQILTDLGKCDPVWLLAIFGVMVVVVMIRSFILFCFARLYTKDYHFHQALACDQVGQFYNAVTPGASGGQIMQAYTYKKQGLHISSAVSALAMYSIVFQIVLILYNILAFIIKFDLIININAVQVEINGNVIQIPALILTIFGFLLNAAVILLVLLMAYWHGFHNFIMGPCVALCHKLHIVKNPDKTRENLRIQVENFKIEFRRLLTNIPFFILVGICFAFYITAKFSIPYFCGLALGSEHTSIQYFWDSVFLGNYHQMVTGLLPIPGSAGVSEYFFAQLFYNSKDLNNSFYLAKNHSADDSYSMAMAALLLWRTITFVIPILFAGFVTAFYRASPKEEIAGKENMPNRQTFVSLQKETYVMRKDELETFMETTRLSRSSIKKRLKEDKPKSTSRNNHLANRDYDSVNIKNEDERL